MYGETFYSSHTTQRQLNPTLPKENVHITTQNRCTGPLGITTAVVNATYNFKRDSLGIQHLNQTPRFPTLDGVSWVFITRTCKCDVLSPGVGKSGLFHYGNVSLHSRHLYLLNYYFRTIFLFFVCINITCL